MNLISVIMPAYNASKYIRESIESILNQSYTNFELLICDDASSDDTIKIIKTFKDSRIKLYVNKKNIGNLKTTNFLLSKCKGDYITIQDADDFSSINRFELLINEFMNDSELGLIGSNFEIINEQNNSISCGFLPLENEQIKFIMQKEVIPMLYASVMIKKEVFNQIGDFRPFFDRKGYADLDWLARGAEFTKVKNIKVILYYYRKHNMSFTATSNDSSIIWRNIHYLLIQVHLYRKAGKVDFFQTENFKTIYSILNELYIRQSENYYWDKKIMKAFKMLIIALRCDYKKLKTFKTFFYMLKNIKIKIIC